MVLLKLIHEFKDNIAWLINIQIFASNSVVYEIFLVVQIVKISMNAKQVLMTVPPIKSVQTVMDHMNAFVMTDSRNQTENALVRKLKCMNFYSLLLVLIFGAKLMISRKSGFIEPFDLSKTSIFAGFKNDF